MPESHPYLFKRIEPDPALRHYIDCYWIATCDDATPGEQKIIPDGFSELIFHFGHPYLIRLNDQWEEQSAALLCGQISKHFSLLNTGTTGMIAVKCKPTAVTHLFGLNMKTYKDKVVDLHAATGNILQQLQNDLLSTRDHTVMTAMLDTWFKARLAAVAPVQSPADKAVERIFASHGLLTVSAMLEGLGISERRLEYLFDRYVGLSPKFFARIIRFNYIFSLVDENEANWSEIVYKAAFFDQSHFIRNFKAFTGENPSEYAFREKNMANFFLQPPRNS